MDGYLGGLDAGVLNNVIIVIFSRNVSICFNDNALWSVSSGRIGGTPPNPSRTKENQISQKRENRRKRYILLLAGHMRNNRF